VRSGRFDDASSPCAVATWPGSGVAHPSAGAINSHPVRNPGRSAARNGRTAATTPAATRRSHTGLAARQNRRRRRAARSTPSTSHSSASREINRTADHRAATAPSPHHRRDDPLTTRLSTRVRQRRRSDNRSPTVTDRRRTGAYCAVGLEQTVTPFRGHRRRAPDLLHLARAATTRTVTTRSTPDAENPA
jgi:hypothetical protein